MCIGALGSGVHRGTRQLMCIGALGSGVHRGPIRGTGIQKLRQAADVHRGTKLGM